MTKKSTAKNGDVKLDDVRRVLVLGGGAPNFTLMSGALLALHEAGVSFDYIYMAGAGAVVGLIYLSPKGLTREQALRNTVNFGISDSIYELMPINYKLFNKLGPSADAFRDFWHDFPPAAVARNQYGMTPAEKLESDWFLMLGAMMCPTDLDYFSTGVCAHAPFIEDVVDFDKLCEASPQCYLGAYCIEDEKMAEFRRHEINLNHFRASLAYPYIYPPYQIGEKHYYEGAAVETLGLIDFAHRTLRIPLLPTVRTSNRGRHTAAGSIASNGHWPDPKCPFYKIVLMDVMKPEVIQRPRDLWNAFIQSIIIPLVANAEKELAMFKHWLNTGHLLTTLKLERRYHQLVKELTVDDTDKRPNAKAYVVRFSVPEWHRPYLLDWTSSNLEFLFDIGYAAGKQFMETKTEGIELQSDYVTDSTKARSSTDDD
jgi:predicted acylesterase/phospholipase RssA